MARNLNVKLLQDRGRHYAQSWLGPDIASRTIDGHFVAGKQYVLRDLYNLSFKDAFEVVMQAFRDTLGKGELAKFDAEWAKVAKPREDAVFHKLLADKLALTPDGDHMERKIGKTQVGQRFIRLQEIEVEHPDSIMARRLRRRLGQDPGPRIVTRRMAPLYWPIYAGEGEERAAGSGVADPLPDDTPGLPIGADTTVISNVAAIAGLDAILAKLDEGTAGGVVAGRTGAQPADVDTAATGTLLFSLLLSATAFGAAADGTGKASATAAAITDDTAADATGTLGYVRGSSSNAQPTPLDDHIDGSAATSGGSWNFNTLSIVAGATVSATSWVVNLPE